MSTVRKGQAPAPMTREQFGERFRAAFFDPAFDSQRDAIARIEIIAWDGYEQARKAPRTAKAGEGFADPDYDLSIEWRATRDQLLIAGQRQKDPKTPSRVLLVCASPRNDGSCPGEMSKTFRLVKLAEEQLEQREIDVDLLDLSRLTSDYDRRIHPCKGCV